MIESVRKIFNNMSYNDDALEETKYSIEWFKHKDQRLINNHLNGTPIELINATNGEKLCEILQADSKEIEAFLTKLAETKNEWIELPALKKTELLYKLSEEIQKQQDFIAELELTVRGISIKDTKSKSLPLLIDFFRYYASFTLKTAGKPEGLATAILSNNNPSWVLGSILGSSLASGHRIVLQTCLEFTPLVTFLIELANRIGFPDNTISTFYGNDANVLLTHPGISLITIFDDIFKNDYNIANCSNKKIVHFGASGTSMVVFENCDLDSAACSVIDAAWGHKGLLPWSVRNIFVQENILSRFIDKFKLELSRVRVGNSNEKNIDIVLPDKVTLEKTFKIIQTAQNDGVEIFQPNPEKIIPTVFIGGNNLPNNVIKSDILNVPIVTLAGFRNTAEAVNLANNTRQSIGLSLWCENVTLVNELIGKFKVNNVWVNCHAQFSAHLTTASKNNSNAITGPEAFYQYLSQHNVPDESAGEGNNSKVMEKTIITAKKAQVSWSETSRFERAEKLLEVAFNTDTLTPEIQKILSEEVGESFINCKNYNVISLQEAIGLVAIEFTQTDNCLDDVFQALLHGNAVIVLANKFKSDSLTSVVGSLPAGLLTIVDYTWEAVKVAALHKELNLFVGKSHNRIFGSLPIKDSMKFNKNNAAFSLTKNVWFAK